MTECIKCKILNLKSNVEMTNVGFSNCDKREKWVFVGINRNEPCADYQVAKPEVIEKRLAWRAQRETRKANG